ncbi:MAG: HAMP domain-containing histidine kinase [Myxococcales bacterium]|nr:HAMP domain-containing histidine kinase [Myxococcales bacterium]
MSRRWVERRRAVMSVVFPLVFVATGILGYYLWAAAARLSSLEEEAIIESTLLLVREKVESIEQMIIGTDNAVFDHVRGLPPEDIPEAWRVVSHKISPTVRAVVVIDEAQNIIAESVRASRKDASQFLWLFRNRLVPLLDLERAPFDQLRHLHTPVAGGSYLLSYVGMEHQGERFYVILHHDTGHIVRTDLPRLFKSEEAQQQFNVVDESNRRIFGPSLARAGDYLVGLRFPSTLYGWRLQVAPKQAPELAERARTRQFQDAALILGSLVILLAGVGFLFYAVAQERKLNDLKSEFIANVSHELKTPLSVVRMFAEMLASGRVASPEKQAQYLDMMIRESERLSGLIDNVLDFAAIERGREKYDRKLGDLRGVLDRTVETFRHRIEPTGLSVTLEAPDELPAVRIDEQGIVLALLNLLDNALKYGGETSIALRVFVDDEKVTLCVDDGGPGIPSESRRRVFERFYRGHKKNEVRGSGIGLSLVRHIAIAHGGTAFVDRSPEGGARVGFSISIDARDARAVV